MSSGVPASQYEPSTIKTTLQQFLEPLSAEGHVLHDSMVEAALTGDDMRSLFPEKPLSGATNHFLHLIMGVEITAARDALDQRSLLRCDRAAFLGSLCSELTAKEQKLAETRLIKIKSELCAGQDLGATDVLFRYCNGESISIISADLHKSKVAVKSALARARKKWYEGGEGMEQITSRFTRHFPVLYATVADGLPDHIGYLDAEVAQLSQRLNDRDFAYLIRSLADVSLNAEEACGLLARLNTPLGRSVPTRASEAVKARVQRKSAAYRDVYKLFQVQYISPPESAPQPRTQPYEEGEEASKLIVAALATDMPRRQRQESASEESLAENPSPKGRFLSKDELFDHAKTVEAGVYAEHLLEQGVDDPERARSLEIIAEQGRESMHTLLRTHVRLVKKVAWRQLFAFESSRDPEDFILRGMCGLLRAVRKYDYRTGHTLTTYAMAWIKNFIARDVFKNDWQLSIDAGERLSKVKSCRRTLVTDLRREPRRAELAEASGLSLPQLEEVLIDELRIRQKPVAIDTLRKASDRYVQTSELDEHARIPLEEALHDQPNGMALLQLRFIEWLSFKQIGQRLNITPAQARAQALKVLKVLHERIGEERLVRLLSLD